MSARSVFADLLAAYRKEAGWTQAEAAQRFTMSSSLYRKIECCDRRPQRDMAVRGDELFGTPKVFARVYQDILTEPHPAWFGPRVEYEDRATVITDGNSAESPGCCRPRHTHAPMCVPVVPTWRRKHLNSEC